MSRVSMKRRSTSSETDSRPGQVSDNFFMPWIQRIIRLKPRSRGFHVITSEIVGQLPELNNVEAGLLHLFIQHTSASLAVNENVSPEVRRDLERYLRELVPDGPHDYEHTLEGEDDMPAHIKA